MRRVDTSSVLWLFTVVAGIVTVLAFAHRAIIVSSGDWTSGVKGAALTRTAFSHIPLIGPTVLTVGLLTFVFSTILEPSDRATNSQPARTPKLGAADIQSLLPIRSPGLSPGPVQSRTHHRPFARPFFLIGSDPRSRQWLVNHRERLRAIGAVGMLVQAETINDLQAIARLAGGLPITPASGADIAGALGVSHYPVLVSSQGIEQ